MKKKLFWVLLAAALVLGGYSAVAFFLLRGAGAYRTATKLGNILAGSWQITALAALILLAVLVIRWRMSVRREKKGLPSPEKAISPARPETEKKKRKMARRDKHKGSKVDKTEILPEAEKIAPAGPATEILPETEKIAPAGPATEILPEAEKIAPAGPATEILPEAEKIAPAGPAAEILPEAEKIAPAGPAAEIVPEAEKIAPAGPVVGARSCPHCGAPLKPNQKFCTVCGTPAEGGAKT